MKKWYIIIAILFVVAGIGAGSYVFNYSKNQYNTPENNSYDASRTSINTTEENNVNNIENSTEDVTNNKSSSKKEISSFTTKIYTKDSDRQNNITVACQNLNGATVKSGDTFSFTNTVGKTSSSKGYQKADVFVDGDVTEAMGGGICQVSTTLYNAVRTVSKLDVTERHEHSNDVPYVAKGRDAAVSYGSYDFKFVNNTDNTIQIEAKNTKNNVTIKLYELK